MRVRKACIKSVVGILLVSKAAFGLGPHEILLIANEESGDSVSIAEEYARLRNVPERNLIRVRVPPHLLSKSDGMKLADFRALIMDPVNSAAAERGIADHVLAWVYSVDFPTRIDAGSRISLQGATFLKGRKPLNEDVRHGTYASPLFCGPSSPQAAGHFPQTFDLYKGWLDKDMPVPSMMLGHGGEMGNSKGEILDCLRVGLSSDATGPAGTVYFVKSDNVRSLARQWQFEPARDELEKAGVKCVITEAFPRGRKDIIGLMMGAPRVNPKEGNTYLPGCMAEHFTSAAGDFYSSHQTKLTEWIAAGATASAGTVTEPYAIWTKFPSARFFVHYSAGCTVMESFYQSIRCPLQILLVGDPLARPWAPEAEIEIRGLAKSPLKERRIIEAVVTAPSGNYYGRIMFLLDGKVVGLRRTLELDPAGLSKGLHRIRAVAYRTGLVRSQVFAIAEFRVEGN